MRSLLIAGGLYAKKPGIHEAPIVLIDGRTRSKYDPAVAENGFFRSISLVFFKDETSENLHI